MISEDLRPMVEEASKTIIYHTLFKCPFPTVWELSDWITEAWADALEVAGKEHERCDEVCRRDVSKSFSTMAPNC